MPRDGDYRPPVPGLVCTTAPGLRPSVLELQGAAKRFRIGAREITALHPLTLSIADGEVFGIVGHSGAGKSTLLRLLNRLETASEGRVLVDGEDVGALDADGLRRLRRRVGMIFQHFNLLSSRSVARNIAFPLELAGTAATVVRKRVDQLLDWVGLGEHRDKYPAQLSGGQKQRVGVARALASSPKLLLCDEATSALDPQTTGAVLDLLDRSNREFGLTIVLITHEMDVVRRICDRVAVLDAGHLVETGPVAEVFLHPDHPTTRRFVAEAEHDDGKASVLAVASGRILRLTFTGPDTYRPMLGQIARDTGIDFSILDGRIDRIKHTPYGQLTIAIDGGDIDTAQARLAQAGVHIEVLRP